MDWKLGIVGAAHQLDNAYISAQASPRIVDAIIMASRPLAFDTMPCV